MGYFHGTVELTKGPAGVRTQSFLFGYDSGVMTDVIASRNFLAYFDTTAGSSTIGAIISTFAGGAFFGALSGGLTVDRLGRRGTIQLGAMVCVVGAILQAASVHLGMMLVGRIITGWAVGIMSMSVPVYQAELAHREFSLPAHRREERR